MFGGWLGGQTHLEDLQAFFFERPDLEGALEKALARKEHVLLYGAPRQGKSTLVGRQLGKRGSVTFHASADTQFADLFRTYLLTLGASVVVEQTRKRKLGAKAEVSWGWPIFSAGGGVEASGESEVTRRNFSADLTNPNDICCLLREFKSAPCLVVEHFEQLGRKQRRLLLEFLRMSAEAGVLQVILVASTLDFPVGYRERLALSRCTTFIELPPLSEAEGQAFVAACLKRLDRPAPPEVAAFLFEVFQGSVEPTLRSCLRAAEELAGHPDAVTLRKTLLADIHEEAQTQFLALVAAIAEADWTFTCARRVARVEAGGARPGRGSVAMAPALAGDPVYRGLRQALEHEDEQPAELPEGMAKLHAAALALGKQVLTTPTEAERVRLLAFALAALAEDPLASVGDPYEPAYGQERDDVKAGIVLCELMLEADLAQELTLTRESLAAHFGASGRELTEPQGGEPAPAGFARRLRRLQRRLGITPPVFRVSDGLDRITLWDPAHALLLGDVKPRLQALLDELRDAEDAP